MSPLDCPFCEHPNPAGAKFCNECGSPLHLTPCGECGAVNNLTDTHCWRCGGLLLPAQAPAPGTPDRQLAELEQRSGASELAPLELEQELAAIEQETRRFVQVSRSAEHPRHFHAEAGDRRASDAVPLLDEVVAERPAARLRRFPAEAAAPLFAGPRAGRRDPWRGLVSVASVAVFVAAIAGGGYLYYRLGAVPAPAPALSEPAGPPGAEASIAPRAGRDLPPALEPVPAPAVASAAPRVDALVEPPVVGNPTRAPEAEPARIGGDAANIITQIGRGTSAPEPTCPAAVAAMALCEWAVKANRQ